MTKAHLVGVVRGNVSVFPTPWRYIIRPPAVDGDQSFFLLNMIKTTCTSWVVAGLLAATLLSACGGGGGNGAANGGNDGGQSGQAANSWLQLTPASLDLTAYEGRALEFSVTAKSSKTIPQTVNIGVVDKSGLISTDLSLVVVGPLEYKAVMKLSDKLAPGNYSGRLEVRLCEDNPLTCAKPITGSPWYVPLKVAVKPSSNLTALADVPQLGPWMTAGGNTRHSAYVPARFDPAKFSQRWVYYYSAASTNIGASASVHANGAAFVVTQDSFRQVLRAIDEASGKVLWESVVPGYIFDVTPPTIAGDKVLVGVGRSYNTGSLIAYDQKTGKLLYEAVVGDVETQAAPLTVGGAVYVHGRSDMGDGYYLYKVNADSGKLEWTSARVSLSPFQTLTADAQNLYAYKDGNLNVIRQSDGAVVAGPLTTSTCYSTGLPALDGQGVLYASCLQPGARPQLVAYDSVGKKQAWLLDNPNAGAVALSGTTVYTARGGTLEARRGADGGLLWSAPLSASGQVALADAAYLLVTDNLAFVSGPTSMVAVDLATHQVVHSFPHGGPMSISSKGVLYLPGDVTRYIEAKAAALIAINLQ